MNARDMEFRIADTFMDSLAKLTNDEQKAVETTAFDLQLNPANPSMSFHKVAQAKDKRFWSVRVNTDVRIIVHRTPESLLLCYVGHHDKAYAWAECRRLEIHPTTGAAQFVEIRERVQEVVLPAYVASVAPESAGPARQSTMPPSKTALLAHVTDDELLRYGVPRDWLGDVRRATEESVLALADHLPAEAAEAVLELATGGTPRQPVLAPPTADPFDHPDAQRRFRVMTDVDELARALDYPWERWTVFLHPAQRELVERRFGGPARVAGSAGTGKTIVALHRAVHLASDHPDARVLLTTFSDALASALRTKLARLIGEKPRVRERIDVETLDNVARRLHDRMLGGAEVASRDVLTTVIRDAAGESINQKFSLTFLLSEWNEVVDAWQLDSWEAYRDVVRLGRKTRLPEKQRQMLWTIFERVKTVLRERGLVTQASVYAGLATHLATTGSAPYDFVVVDEAQDVSVPQLRFVAVLGTNRPDALFFAGDLGQRIFQLPFSWRSLGVDIRGRSAILRINYRTSHQIRMQADRLLGKQIADVDGNIEDRRGTVSAFNGPQPLIRVLPSADAEVSAVGAWLTERTKDGVLPGEMAVFVRSAAQIARACAAVEAAKIPVAVLDENVKTVRDRVSVATMPLSKGLEFRAVAVMACDDEVLPLQSRIETVADDADLEDVYDTERHLLYVACTRARDHLLVTGVRPASEFLDDLRAARATMQGAGHRTGA